MATTTPPRKSGRQSDRKAGATIPKGQRPSTGLRGRSGKRVTKSLPTNTGWSNETPLLDPVAPSLAETTDSVGMVGQKAPVPGAGKIRLAGRGKGQKGNASNTSAASGVRQSARTRK